MCIQSVYVYGWIRKEKKKHPRIIIRYSFLVLSLLGKNFNRWQDEIFFQIFPENKLWHPHKMWVADVVKVLCILRHWGIQLIMAYSWTRLAILVAGKGKGRNVFISSVSLLSFLFFFLPCPSHLLYCLFYLFSPFLRETTQNDPQWRVKPQHNQWKPHEMSKPFYIQRKEKYQFGVCRICQ